MSHPTLEWLNVAPGHVPGGDAATGTVILEHHAPHGGVLVTLASTSPAASVPPSVLVPAGEKEANFTITTEVVIANTDVIIHAHLHGSHAKEAKLVVEPPSIPTLVALSIVPDHFLGGDNAVGSVSLSSPAPPTGIVVAVTASSTELILPPMVTVPIGALNESFPIASYPVTAVIHVTVDASISGSNTKQAHVTLYPLDPNSVPVVTVAAGSDGFVGANWTSPPAGQSYQFTYTGAGLAEKSVTSTAPSTFSRGVGQGSTNGSQVEWTGLAAGTYTVTAVCVVTNNGVETTFRGGATFTIA
jgi:trimeric autotransporter adhesin